MIQMCFGSASCSSVNRRSGFVMGTGLHGDFDGRKLWLVAVQYGPGLGSGWRREVTPIAAGARADST